MTVPAHNTVILDQLSRQAEAFNADRGPVCPTAQPA